MAIATPAQKRKEIEDKGHVKKRSGSESKQKLEIKRLFTFPNKDPYESVKWGIRDAVAGDFEQKGVEAPVCWSDSAVGICSKLYFATCEGKRESSIKTLIRRVVQKITNEGIKHGYFDEEGSFAFEAELAYIIIHQFASFNSPVWFNLGIPGRRQTCSACYLLNVEDRMRGDDSITEWISTEAAIFKTGGGAGVNLSKLRGSKESLSTGGVSSGPVPFMRWADAGAGSIKSGSTRRAAKSVCLDADHPDILDFIDCKVREDRRMRALMDAGFNLDPSTPEGEKNIAESTSFQNANISVRLSDKFMKAVEKEDWWQMPPRTGKGPTGTIGAKELLKRIAEATWQCADPGVMFDDTINAWHTTPSLGRIETSNPCMEVQTNNNSSCNLASINLVKFLDDKKGFLFKRFNQVVDIMITAMDITCSFSELPTKKLEENTRNLRQLGLGYSNLGAALMIQGMPYDSDEGRDWSASVTSLMTGRAYKRSAGMAQHLDPFAHYEDNHESMHKVLDKHAFYANNYLNLDDEIADNARIEWAQVVGERGFRNSQVTVIAPTGSISFMMDCDTTGAEPLYSPITYKKFASGGMIEQKPECYEIAFNRDTLHPDEDMILQTASGNNSISADGHIKMLAAIQPHISGSISKTCNLPESASVQDIYDIYMKAWKMGIKCLAVYRDGSKVTQILSTEKQNKLEDFTDENQNDLENISQYLDSKTENSLESKNSDFVAQKEPTSNADYNWGKNGVRRKSDIEIKELDLDNIDDEAFNEIADRSSVRVANHTSAGTKILRRKMSPERKSITHKFVLGSHEGYITAGMFDDGTLGEIFLSGIGKEGSTLRGIMDAFAISISLGLQHGVPLETLAEKFSHMDFEPKGLTNNPEIRTAHSMPDYIMRWLVSKFGDKDLCDEVGIRQVAIIENKNFIEPPIIEKSIFSTNVKTKVEYGKICTCGAQMMRSGVCWSCSSCGMTTGCA